MSQKKVGDKLSHISKSGAVASLTEGDVHGWYNSYCFFNNSSTTGINDPNNGFLNSGKFLNSRGVLPYYRPDGTQVFSPYERFSGCGIVLAKDRNYSPEHTDFQVGVRQDFYRMYYHPDIREDLAYSNDTWPLPDYEFKLVLSDLSVPGNGFFPFGQSPEAEDVGGYLFNYAANGGEWTLIIGGLEYNQDYFFQFGEEGEGVGDLNGDNFASTSELLELLTSYDLTDNHTSVYGGPSPTTGPLAAGGMTGVFREIMLEPPSYPNGGLVSEEMIEYPQRWTMHVHDGLRNSTLEYLSVRWLQFLVRLWVP